MDDILERIEDGKKRGLTMRQIAAELGISPEALYQRKHRALFGRNPKKSIDHKAIPAEKPRSEIKISGSQDEMEIESVDSDGRIRTLEDLLAHAKADLTAWEVSRWEANSWEVAMKDDFGEPKIVPVYQVKAKFTPIKENAPLPVLQPVQITLPKFKLPKPVIGRVKRALITSDWHIGFQRDIHTGSLTPYHDETALSVVEQISRQNPFDKRVCLGDGMDMAEWSDKFIRAPGDMFVTQQALNATAEWMARLGITDYIEGNHEHRLERLIINQMQAVYQLSPAGSNEPALSVKSLLNLDRLGVRYYAGYPNAEMWLSDNLRLVHGDIVRGGNGKSAAALSAAPSTTATTGMGHIHRMELAPKTLYYHGEQKDVFSFSAGCLCHLDGRVPGMRPGQQWQRGIIVLEYTDTNHSILFIPISNGMAIYDRKEYAA